MRPAAIELQSAVARVLEAALPEVPVICWRRKTPQSDHEARMAALKGLCVFVPVPVPTSALQGTPFVFFDGYEVRVQVVEIPAMNEGGALDIYDVVEAVTLGLHWQPKEAESPLVGMLAHPLTLAERPVEMAEGVVADKVPGLEHQEIRGADVIFNAVMQLNQSINEPIDNEEEDHG